MPGKRKPDTFKSLLKRIASFLAKDSRPAGDAKKMWDVLSALRGPDIMDHWYDPDAIGGDPIKAATTGVIRNALGLPSQIPMQGYGPRTFYTMSNNPDSAALANQRADFARRKSYAHFLDHAHSAFKALGLKWHTENKPKPTKAKRRKK